MLRFVRDQSSTDSEHRLAMSSMIDIVFLLLVFFVMTFQITPQEGDLMIGATEAVGSRQEAIATSLPLRLRLTAAPDGALGGLRLNDAVINGFDELRTRLIALDQDVSLRETAMTLDCDSNLRYEHVIAALDHVTGYRDAAGQLQPLVGSTRFVTRR